MHNLRHRVYAKDIHLNQLDKDHPERFALGAHNILCYLSLQLDATKNLPEQLRTFSLLLFWSAVRDDLFEFLQKEWSQLIFFIIAKYHCFLKEIGIC